MSSNTEYLKYLREFILLNYSDNTSSIVVKFLKKYEKSFFTPTSTTCERRVQELRRQLQAEGLIPTPQKKEIPKKEFAPSVDINIVDVLKRKEIDKEKIISTLSKKECSLDTLSSIIKQPVDYIKYVLDELKQEKYNLLETDNLLKIETSAKVGGFSKIDISKFHNKVYKIGAISDNHINSKFERLDVLNAIYDIYEKEGITEVYNGGNWIEGDARWNRYEVKNRGASKQVDYFLSVYPQKKNITTYFIAGDDHEGWYWQREGLNIGEYTEMKAQKIGRVDLKYLGYVEADVEFHAKNGHAKMRIMHPGGGSAYAVSYSPQKMIESFQGGEKPNILLLGHYHKADYFCYRDVHCCQLGTTQSQSTFMRKHKIQAHIGAWILEFQQAEDGSINRFKVEWLSFFNNEFYDRQQYYI